MARVLEPKLSLAGLDNAHYMVLEGFFVVNRQDSKVLTKLLWSLGAVELIFMSLLGLP